MRSNSVYSFLVLTLVAFGGARAQIVLDSNPARTIGQAGGSPANLTQVFNINPNLGQPGGMYLPQGIAVDTTNSILYVADTENNRVLAWQNASAGNLKNTQPDKVIGQPNFYTTLPAISGGLYYPSGLLVDSKGYLYIADSGNNRVLRYPPPFAAGSSTTPDMVIGQPDPYTSRKSNQGGAPSATTLSFQTGSGAVLLGALAMDSSGNLYVADPGNGRVLGYPASSLTTGTYAPAADVVIGQQDFVTVMGPTNQLDRNYIASPSGIAFDSAGHLFVTDSLASRLMVFPKPNGPASNGVAAIRLAGITTSSTTSASSLLSPDGVVMVNNGPAVVDSANNRVLIFDAFSSPDWTTSDSTFANPPPVAISVIGQANFTASSANGGTAQPSAATLAGPVAIAVAGANLYLTDTSNNRVLIFPNTSQGASATQVLGQNGFTYSSPNAIRGNEFWFSPTSIQFGGQPFAADAGIALDLSANPPHLYVSDPGNNRVLAFSNAWTAGASLAAYPPDLVIGEPDAFTAVCNYGGVRPASPASGQLNQQPTASSLCYPTGLAVDPATGDLYVADSLNGRVVRFPAPFANPAPMEPANLVLGQTAFTGLKNPAVSQSTMGFPYGLLWDASNGLLVSDTEFNRVLVFAKDALSNGGPATKVIGQSLFTTQNTTVMSQPHHIAEDSQARVYVTDSHNGRVLIFQPLPFLGTETTNTALPASTISGLSYPQAIWVNPTNIAGYPDDIWVGDSTLIRRFQRYDFLGQGSTTPVAQVPAATLQAGGSEFCVGTSDCIPPTGGVLALTQDAAGNLLVADASNRIGIHYQALAARNNANFICAMSCAALGEAPPNPYVAPDTIVDLAAFSVPFGGSDASFTDLPNPLPVPTTLGDRQVLVNGRAAPIFFVRTSVAPNGHIYFVVPFETPTSGAVPVQVVQPSTGQILGSGSLGMGVVSPALFTSNQQGTGQIAVINQDGSVNGPSHPAPAGSTISLYGTGQGSVPNAPPDGQIATGVISTQVKPRVFIDPAYVDDSAVTYSGLAPDLVAVWQINVQIPKTTAPGNAVPLLLNYESIYSIIQGQTATTISVK